MIVNVWTLERDEAGIAWLSIDCPGNKPNTLDRTALDELGRIVDQLNIDLPTGLVLYSKKPQGLIAGADVNEFRLIENAAQAREHIAFVHRIFDCLEQMPIPRVALIHGYGLGGGLELALTCDYLIAEDDPGCKLGLPEVRLGIHPGYGGSVRLIERVGVLQAMNMMLAGRVISARSAKKLGLVDQSIARRHFKTAARDYIQRRPKRRQAPGWQGRLLNHAWVRPILGRYFEKQLKKRIDARHYPAPYALLELWRKYGDKRSTMLAEEINSASDLFITDSARNLVRVFFLQEQLKSAGKDSDAQGIAHLHVIGAGVMGGDIAAWSALRGIRVTLQDQNDASIARAVARAHTLFQKKLKLAPRVQAAMDRLMPDPDGAGVARADLIIEAIFEDLDAKRALFVDLETRTRPGAILASNTSSIPIEQIAEVLEDPTRLVGIHFFNPVAKMQLVEVVRGAQSAQAMIDGANAYILQISRLPVGVRSSPGFLVNRVLMPYLIEAVRMLDEGIAASEIDRAALEFGMPMGPIELADVVGLDICLHVAQNLLGEAQVPQSLRAKVENGQSGKKSGQGYYRWVKGKANKPAVKRLSGETEDLARRMIYPLLNECVACLDEGVVASADELDAGVIFGTGFAPFRGGPVAMIRHETRAVMINRLERLQANYGDRFKPGEGWENMQLF